MTKTCSHCGLTKSLDEFHKRKKSPSGRQVWCKLCNREARKLAYRNNPHQKKVYQRGYALKKAYGISVDDYAEMAARQQGKCFVCGKLEDPLCVDHDHKTGKIRKLLCKTCNLILGIINEDPSVLRRMASYVETNGA